MDYLYEDYNRIYSYLSTGAQCHSAVGLVNALLQCEDKDKQKIDNNDRLQSYMTLLGPVIKEDYTTDPNEAALDQVNLAKLSHLISVPVGMEDLEVSLMSTLRQHF